MEKILAEAMKVAEEAEVFEVRVEETIVQFEANRLKHLQTKQTTGVALRIIKNGRIGYATATMLDDSEALISGAVETAQFGAPARFHLPGIADYPRVEVLDTAVEAVPVEAMIKLGEELIASTIAHTPGILCEAGVSRSITSVRIINSGGGQASYRKSSFDLGIEGTLIEDTDMLFVGDSESSCHPVSGSKAVSDAVLQQLELARNRASVPSKSLPVVFTAYGVASALIPPLMTAFNGKTVLEGASPIGNKSGQQVFDEKLSLWDNPTIAYRPSSRPCDDEGMPSQRTTLIDRGVITSFLYDLQTAALANVKSTGNGSRSRGGQPSPSPSAFIIAPGSATFGEMVQDIKEGLVIEQMMGAGQGNVLGGDFSGNVLLGYKIENGEIVGRVKDTMISGNVYQVLKHITAVGRESRWVGDFLQTPHIYCPDVAVASKG